jgi:hypothetical protein
MELTQCKGMPGYAILRSDRGFLGENIVSKNLLHTITPIFWFKKQAQQWIKQEKLDPKTHRVVPVEIVLTKP